MTPLLLAVLACAAVTVGLGVLHARRRSPTQRRRRLIVRVPNTPIVAVKDGETVRITGRAHTREPLRTSPIGQRRCIGFRVTIDSEGTGTRVIDREEFDSFTLRDDTGEAFLHAPFDINLDPYDVGSGDLPPTVVALLEQEGVARTEMFGVPRQFRFSETVLLPGERITALGRATIEVDPTGHAPAYRGAPLVCHMRGIDAPVVIDDVDD